MMQAAALPSSADVEAFAADGAVLLDGLVADRIEPLRSVHGAAADKARTERHRASSARWVGDDARFADRKGKGSPPFRHLTPADGDRLNGPDVPVVYQA